MTFLRIRIKISNLMTLFSHPRYSLGFHCKMTGITGDSLYFLTKKGASIKYVTLFLAPPSVTLCPTSRDLPQNTSHISDFSVGLVQKTPRKAPCTNSLSIVRGGFCQGMFCPGWFL